MARPNPPRAAFNRRPIAAPPIHPSRDMTPEDIAALDRTLTRLITNYETAEAAYLDLSHRPYPPHIEAARLASDLAAKQWAEMTAAYEQASGLVAASDLSDAAYDRMINFTQQILTLSSVSLDVLRLKARACLFEAPLERIREEGFSGLAVLMEQLIALEPERSVIAPAPG